MANFEVSFFDRVSGWLHSKFAVEVEDVADAVEAALAAAKDAGADLSSHNAAVVDENGAGVPSIVTSTSQTALEQQMADLQRQLAQLKSASQTPTAAEIAPAPAESDNTDNADDTADAGTPAMPVRPSQQ